MTEEELVKRWYDDIKQSSDHSWFDRLFKFPKHEATYGQFFDVLPEPIRGYAIEECETSLTHLVDLSSIFDHGFTWSDTVHGKTWQRLLLAIDNRVHGKEIEIPTLDYLLSTLDD